MKKFNVTATRVDHYEIEIDESVWDEHELKAWSKVFYDVDDVSDIVKHLSFSILRFGSTNFYDGIGTVRTLRKDGSKIDYRNGDHDKGIILKIISEDEDYDIELNEIKNSENLNTK